LLKPVEPECFHRHNSDYSGEKHRPERRSLPF
jgi:hypothetical protein